MEYSQHHRREVPYWLPLEAVHRNLRLTARTREKGGTGSLHYGLRPGCASSLESDHAASSPHAYLGHPGIFGFRRLSVEKDIAIPALRNDSSISRPPLGVLPRYRG